VDDVHPRPAPSARPEKQVDTIDGIPKKTLVTVVGGAVAIFLFGFVALSIFGGGDDDPPDQEAQGDTSLTEVQPSIPFEPPPVPEDDGLPAEASTVEPEEWDPVVRDLIPFIEEERNLRFSEPVEIRMLSTAELQGIFGSGGAGDPLAEESLREQIAIYRGLGIYQGDIDAAAFLRQAGEIGVTGLYVPSEDIVYLNKDVGAQGAPGTSPFQQAVLLHELVHALQDQVTDIDEPVWDYQFLTMQRMMIEGDARRVERDWAAQLPPEQYEQYWGTMNSLLNPEGFNGVLGIEGDFIYEGGMAVTHLVEVLDSTETLDVLLEYPPNRPAQLLRASTLFLHSEEPWAEEAVVRGEPTMPPDGIALAEGQLGAWTWYVTLATRLDGAQALRAADAIGGDQVLIYQQGGRLCGSYRVHAAGEGETGQLAAAMRNWAAALPHGAAVHVEDQFVQVQVCDPGAAAPMNFLHSPQDIVDGPIARTAVVAEVLEPQRGWWAEDELRERERWCLAETVQRAVSLREVLDGLTDERIAELGEAAVKACLPERVPGGPPPIDGDCSAQGMEAPALDDAGLPDAVAQTRRQIIEAARACDYEALTALLAKSGPFLGDSLLPPADRAGQLVDRWERQEALNQPVLARLVDTVGGGWMCGPDMSTAVEGRTGDACAFASGGGPVVDDRALVAVIGLGGGWIGFGSNVDAQQVVLGVWADTVTGDRAEASYTIGGGDPQGRLPYGWPRAVAPAALLAED
jgi:hypothetical protein